MSDTTFKVYDGCSFLEFIVPIDVEAMVRLGRAGLVWMDVGELIDSRCPIHLDKFVRVLCALLGPQIVHYRLAPEECAKLFIDNGQAALDALHAAVYLEVEHQRPGPDARMTGVCGGRP